MLYDVTVWRKWPETDGCIIIKCTYEVSITRYLFLFINSTLADIE